MTWLELRHDLIVIAGYLVGQTLVNAWWKAQHCWLRLRRHRWQPGFRYHPENLTTWTRCERCGWLKRGSLRIEKVI